MYVVFYDTPALSANKTDSHDRTNKQTSIAHPSLYMLQQIVIDFGV